MMPRPPAGLGSDGSVSRPADQARQPSSSKKSKGVVYFRAGSAITDDDDDCEITALMEANFDEHIEECVSAHTVLFGVFGSKIKSKVVLFWPAQMRHHKVLKL